MKFRKNSTREFCVTNALGLGMIVYIKCPFLVLFTFCQKTYSIRNFSIAIHSQLFEISVLFQPITVSHSKKVFSRSNKTRTVNTSHCLAHDQNLQ